MGRNDSRFFAFGRGIYEKVRLPKLWACAIIGKKSIRRGHFSAHSSVGSNLAKLPVLPETWKWASFFFFEQRSVEHMLTGPFGSFVRIGRHKPTIYVA
jgi:hypothetical protein